MTKAAEVDSPVTIQRALAHACRQLENSQPGYRIDAETLLCHVLGCNSAKLIAWPEQLLTTEQQAQFCHLVEQRRQGMPVAYLTGRREFWSLELKVTPDTLIPRPETELLVETVLELCDASQPLAVADLGTGSGAIACALASERPAWQLIATDISSAALAVAQQNASHHQLKNIRFIHSDWFSALADECFDVIVSNPPYVASHDEHLAQGDVRFEPVTALTAGHAGMDDIEHLCRRARRHLNPGGLLVFEHGYDQQQAAFNCLKTNAWKAVFQHHDLAGHTRISGGRC